MTTNSQNKISEAPLGLWRSGMQVIGERVMLFVSSIGEIAYLAGLTVRGIFRYRVEWNEVIRQCFFIGNRSMAIVLLTGLFTGMVLALQFIISLSNFGLKNYTGQMVALSLTRELGPVLTSLMVAARVGSGIAAEIGSMVVTEQVLAIESMGANPIHKLVVPRTIAMMISVPLLTVFADAIGIIGGMVISKLEANVSFAFYMQQVWNTVGMDDFLHGIFKTVFFAFTIVQVACHKGLSTSGGTEGVGRSTTKAVVISSISIFIMDFFLTKLFILL